MRISLHRENQPAFVVTMRGNRKRAGIAEIIRLQLVAPLAPLMGAIGIRIQGITLWLRRVPVVPRTDSSKCRVPSPRQRKSRPVVSIDLTVDPSRPQLIPTDGPPWRGCPAGRSAPRRALSRTGCSAARRHGYRSASSTPTARWSAPPIPTLPTMVVHRPEAMVRRVGRYGLIGFGESYMAGDWSSS